MRRHDLDLFSLVAGLVFVAVAAGHLLDVWLDLDMDGRFVAPLALVTIGVASLAGLLRSTDRAPAATEEHHEREETAAG